MPTAPRIKKASMKASADTLGTASATAPVTPESTAYLLRIELRDLKPTIYREVLVDPAMSLAQLHEVIQAAMGWENSHMHGFAMPGGKRLPRFWNAQPDLRIEPPETQVGFDEEKPRSTHKVRVKEALPKLKDKLLYMYDFGDDWEHVITFKSLVLTSEPLPKLVKAEHGCPPEDCGGPGGFADQMQIFHDPSHPEHEEIKEWLGEDFEPGALDLVALQAAVKRLAPKVRSTKKVL